jgi:hypothetical protein
MLQMEVGSELRRQIGAAAERKRMFANLKPRVVIPIQNLDVPATVIPQKWNWDSWRPRQLFPSVRDVMRSVATYYHIEILDIISHRRTADVVKPRHVFFYLSRRLTTRSLVEIGRECDDRDHTTVLHGIRRITALVDAGDPIIDDIADMRHRIGRRLDAQNVNRMEAVEILGS